MDTTTIELEERRRSAPFPTYPSRSGLPQRRLLLVLKPTRQNLAYLSGIVLVGLVLGGGLLRARTTPFRLWPASQSRVGDCSVVGTLPSLPTIAEEPWTLDRVQRMVESTRGYYARDYSLWLGWNNIRYIIEAGLLQASLLDRTLIIPSFVYARHCEFQESVCAAFLEMVNRGDSIGWDEWRDQPTESQLGWKIPIEMMMDLKLLRKKHAVLTMADFLRLKSLPVELEQNNGQWSDDAYRTHARTIPNSWWDPPEVIRVDRQLGSFQVNRYDPISVRAWEARDAVKQKIEGMFGTPDTHVLEWDPVQRALQGMDLGLSEEATVSSFLRAAGFEVLHTYYGSRGTEFTKSVAIPIKQIARAEEVHGMVDDFGSWSDEIVHLQGEVHLDRKPGSMRFTTAHGLGSFSRTVLYDTRTVPDIVRLAARVADRMRERTGGRMWRAAHVRRGDFVRYTWSDQNLARHITDVKNKLKLAPDVLGQIRSSNSASTFDVPDAHPNAAIWEGDLPRADDPWYIATDERNPWALDHIRSQGGVLIMDLLTPEDRQIVGWPLLITDILALVDQQVLARAAYFYGSGLSSVTGGVMNLRAIAGFDPRTTVVD